MDGRFLQFTASRERGRRPRGPPGQALAEALLPRRGKRWICHQRLPAIFGRNEAPRRRARASAVLEGGPWTVRLHVLQRVALPTRLRTVICDERGLATRGQPGAPASGGSELSPSAPDRDASTPAATFGTDTRRNCGFATARFVGGRRVSKSQPPPHARRRATHASDPSDHNTQRLPPTTSTQRRLERRVPPRDVREARERLGKRDTVPPHGNHVRPVAPLVIQRMVVAAPQR